MHTEPKDRKVAEKRFAVSRGQGHLPVPTLGPRTLPFPSLGTTGSLDLASSHPQDLRGTNVSLGSISWSWYMCSPKTDVGVSCMLTLGLSAQLVSQRVGIWALLSTTCM